MPPPQRCSCPRGTVALVFMLVCTGVIDEVVAAKNGVAAAAETETQLLVQDWDDQSKWLQAGAVNTSTDAFVLKPVWKAWSLEDVLAIDFIVESMNVLIQHLALMRSQFGKGKMALCCKHDVDDEATREGSQDQGTEQFVFEYQKWADSDTSRAATITSLQGRVHDLFKLANEKYSVEDWNNATKKQALWNDVHGLLQTHLVMLVINFISYLITCPNFECLWKFLMFVSFTATVSFVLISQSHSESIILIFMLTNSLVWLSFNAFVWRSVLGISVCQDIRDVPLMWRQSEKAEDLGDEAPPGSTGRRNKAKDTLASQQKFRANAYTACKSHVKSVSGSHGNRQCPVWDEWDSCVQKSDDGVRRSAQQCREMRQIFDECGGGVLSQTFRVWKLVGFVGFYLMVGSSMYFLKFIRIGFSKLTLLQGSVPQVNLLNSK